MKQLTVNQAMRIAIQHHQAGRLAEAEEIYHQVLSRQPDHPDALHLLGVAANQAGRLDAAIDLIRQAIALSPATAVYHDNLGNALRDQGLLDEAIAAYREAIRLNPSGPSAYNNLGNALREKGSIDEALTTCRAALRLKPDFAEAHNNLGSVLREKGLLEQAVAAYRQAIQLKPDFVEAHNNLGNALHDMGMFDEAVAAYQHTLQIKPDLADAHNNLGNVLRERGQPNEAVAAFRRAIQLRPDFAEAYCNLGVAFKDKGEFDQAIASFKRAIELKPDYALAHWNYCFLLLLSGDFVTGWREYEWRLALPDAHLGRDFSQPRWNGQDPRGKTILLYTEGGFGDALHFIRYAPLLADLGANLFLECQPELHSLLKRVRGIFAIFSRGESLPPFDWQTPLLSLPLAFGTTLETIPREAPYLSAPPEQIAKWRNQLASDRSIRIGLAWAGRRVPKDLRSRSLAIFAPLASVPGTTFYALQKGPEARQPIPPGLNLVNVGDSLADFADTAALMMNLDVVISVDTSVAHLAAALGLPVWTLIPRDPDFRWLRDREDSPWYPTMRLFRQKSRGDWNDVIRRLANSLDELACRRLDG